MAEFLGKVYKFTKSENDEGYTDALGVSGELKQRYLQAKPDISLVKNGDGTFTLKLTPIMELVFTDGKEFDEVLAPGFISKSTITVENNVVKHIQKHPSGKVVTIIRQFGAAELVTTSTIEGWNGKAVRYYTAV